MKRLIMLTAVLLSTSALAVDYPPINQLIPICGPYAGLVMAPDPERPGKEMLVCRTNVAHLSITVLGLDEVCNGFLVKEDPATGAIRLVCQRRL